eukprot:TRINITY_DN1759_c0_g1_i1.p1 TRINITY_DN1759_c0_g1~~TRINITY_DN1759_c0_g1_i1.p1  ORF type:complete len:444 (+),score=119.18 TRINITY_DN1759_c0_g1_i1:68-1333(+)
MALFVVLFVVAFFSQQIVGQQINVNSAETVNANVPQLNSQNNFFVSFDFEDLAPTCCPGPLPSCGDGKCNRTENCVTCPQDCKCLFCGDGLCLKTDNETCTSCPQDCGKCPVTSVCGDGVCQQGKEACGNCPVDCGLCVICGDGVCDLSENCDSCPLDCGGSCPTGSLVGGAMDVLTELPISGVLVETLNVRPGSEYYMTTNNDGNFYFHVLPVQIVRLRATHPLYGVATASVQIPLNGLANITIWMAPAIPDNAWKIRLTWGAQPTDLDLTMFGDWELPYKSGVVNWESSNKSSATPFSVYSGDQSNGFGPEYVDILKFGKPRQNVEIWVHNYSGDRKNASETLIGSNARVLAYTDRQGIQGDWTINSTGLTGKETWWHVFSLTPAQKIVVVNKFYTSISAAPCGWVQYCPYRPMDLFLK